MSINQLTGIGVSPGSPAPISTGRKISTPDTDITSSSISTASDTINNKPKSEEQIQQAVQKIQGVVDNLAHNLHFSIDEDTGKTVIKVMDTHTKEVIRQIPTEEAINIARTLDKVQGLLFNDKA